MHFFRSIWLIDNEKNLLTRIQSDRSDCLFYVRTSFTLHKFFCYKINYFYVYDALLKNDLHQNLLIAPGQNQLNFLKLFKTNFRDK